MIDRLPELIEALEASPKRTTKTGARIIAGLTQLADGKRMSFGEARPLFVAAQQQAKRARHDQRQLPRERISNAERWLPFQSAAMVLIYSSTTLSHPDRGVADSRAAEWTVSGITGARIAARKDASA